MLDLSLSWTEVVLGLLGLLVSWGLFVLLWSYIRWRTTPLRKIPGPPIKSYLLGDFRELYYEPFFEPHKRWWKEAAQDNEEVKLLHYTSLFGRSAVVVLDADILKEICLAPAAAGRFRKNMQILRQIIGDGLVTLEGKDWSRHRRIIQPSFHTGILRQHLDECVPPFTQILLDGWERGGRDGTREIDVASHFSTLTFDVLGEVAFSRKFQALDALTEWADRKSTEDSTGVDDDDAKLSAVSDPLLEALIESFKLSLLRTVFAAIGHPWLDNILNPKSRRTHHLLNAAVDDVIAHARQKEVPNDETSNGNGRKKNKSLLELLLKAKDVEATSKNDEYLSNAELRDETKTFLVAGHETTSTWCYWVLYCMAHYPEVQQKVYKDICKHSPDPNEPIHLSQVQQMDYFNAMMKEVLRLLPPVGATIRYTTQDETLGGYHIPSNTRLVLPIHLMHRHPKYWKQGDPNEFRPERWLLVGDNSGKASAQPEPTHRFAFVPFAAGGRNCIGQNFATVEAKLILAPLLRKFRVQLAPSLRGTEFTFTNFITMKAKPGFKIVVSSRDKEAK